MNPGLDQDKGWRGEMFREEYNVIHPDWRTPVFVTVSFVSHAERLFTISGKYDAWYIVSKVYHEIDLSKNSWLFVTSM